MGRTAFVQGASRGLGLEFVRQLAVTHDQIIATCRRPADAHALAALAASNPAISILRLDVEDEASIARATQEAAGLTNHLDLVINTAGMLHAPAHEPERRLVDVGAASLACSFAVNAIGPIVVARYLEPLLAKSERAVFAAISARVGSIADNRLGGWYSYRASKAALNMLIKTLAIEWARRKPPITCVALHPGTVETDLSRPFLRNGTHRTFSAELAVRQLIPILADAAPKQSGAFSPGTAKRFLGDRASASVQRAPGRSRRAGCATPLPRTRVSARGSARMRPRARSSSHCSSP